MYHLAKNLYAVDAVIPVSGVRCSSGVELFCSVFCRWLSVVRGVPVIVVTEIVNFLRRRTALFIYVVDSVSNRFLARNHCIATINRRVRHSCVFRDSCSVFFAKNIYKSNIVLLYIQYLLFVLIMLVYLLRIFVSVK